MSKFEALRGHFRHEQKAAEVVKITSVPDQEIVALVEDPDDVDTLINVSLSTGEVFASHPHVKHDHPPENDPPKPDAGISKNPRSGQIIFNGKDANELEAFLSIVKSESLPKKNQEIPKQVKIQKTASPLPSPAGD